MKTGFFEQPDFVENPLFESIIADLAEKEFSIADGFFDPEEVALLRNSLLSKYEADRFKKSAIGSRTQEEVIEKIRGDFILWIDENRISENKAEQLFFR